MKVPKILVGCPTHERYAYCFDKYLDAVRKIDYSNFDVFLVDNSKGDKFFNRIKNENVSVVKTEYFDDPKERIVSSRNVIRQKVLDEGYDYFFSLEQDVISPSDIIKKLLSHDKKIVSGVYFMIFAKNNKTRTLPLLWKRVDKSSNIRPLSEKELWRNDLLEVDFCGLGCVLIHRDVLEKVKFRFLKHNKDVFDDIYFCNDAANHSFKIFADTSIKCRHLFLNKFIKDGVGRYR